MDVIDLLGFEEGWREKPYIDTEGYPTIGYGFKIGPKLAGGPNARQAALEHYYQFTLPRHAGNVWLLELAAETYRKMAANNRIAPAVKACVVPEMPPLENPRIAVLVSMAYQMGVEGLAGFRNTLMCITNQDWFQAETQMLKSKWASQTPKRARRHAHQMRTGSWHPEYGRV